MISKFEENLLTEFYRAQAILNYHGINENGCELLLLTLIIKEDSLLNCIVKTDIDFVINIIIENYEKYNYERISKYQEMLSFSESISLKDKEIMILDEHLLYAVINVPSDFIKMIFAKSDVLIDKVMLSVENYFEFDNEEFLVDLSKQAMLNKFNPFIGRIEYIEKIIRIISKKQKNNCILIGSAGVGKSALVEGVAMELFKRKIDITIYRLELGVIVAGTRYRGDLEERLVNVIKRIKDEKAILFIDEIHNIMGGTKGEDAINIANILKPILARSEIKCIGATTLEEYYEYIEKDKAFTRRFQTIFIPEATKEETLQILKKIKYKYEEFYNIKYSIPILESIINNCLYFPNRKFPDKAIDILDELGAYTISKGFKKPQTKDIKKIVFENIGLHSSDQTNLNHPEILKYYNLFINQKPDSTKDEVKTTIMSVLYIGDKCNSLISDIKKVFNLKDEAIITIDFELADEYSYNYIINIVLKFPITCIVISNFEKGNYFYNLKIRKIIDVGYAFDTKERLVSFKNTIFVFDEKEAKEKIGFENIKNSKSGSDCLFDLTISKDAYNHLLKKV